MPTPLSYVAGGDPAAPCLLLVHAMGADASFWDACRAVWEEAFFCVACDLRGAGSSPAAEAPLTIEGHAEDLEGLRRHLGLAHVIPVGCAVGAMVAASYAGRWPQHCDALVLCNPGYRTQPSARAMLLQRAADVRQGGMAAVMPTAIDTAFANCSDDERRRAYAERFAAQDPTSYAFAVEGMLGADVSGALPPIRCPTLVVAGGADRLLPREHAEAVTGAIVGSRLVTIEAGAHFIPYQRPEEFASMVAGFLAEPAVAAGLTR